MTKTIRRRLLRPLRRGQTLTAVLVVALGIGSSLAAAQDTPDEMREERREVQEEAAEVALDVNALTDDIDALTDALLALHEAVDAQEASLDAATRRIEAAEVAEAAAQTAIDKLEADIASTKETLLESAVNSFMGFLGPLSGQAALDSNPWQYARTESLVEFGNGNSTEIIDELRALKAELESEKEEAVAHTAELDQQKAEVVLRVIELDLAVQREGNILDAVEDRLDARLAEVAALESLDADLAAEITAEEQRIASAIIRRNRERSVTIPDNAPVDLTVVRGLTVNVLIADNVEGFLAAMEARGFSLSGGGYRSSDSQINLRRSHCGTSDYAIWEMPASQCRPPTARPGRSAHERGLAIDFTYRGSIIRSRNSDVFRAMEEVALAYGFKNLPSEPWHWSTTGG